MAVAITSPALAQLEFLIGTWEMQLSGASFRPAPDAILPGLVEFRPIGSGASRRNRAFERRGKHAEETLIED